MKKILPLILILPMLQSIAQNLPVNGNLVFGSEYNHITWPINTSHPYGGGITADDGNYKRLTFYHGHSIAFETGSNTRNHSYTKMYIKSDGNVGIGTTSPQTKLHVKGDGTLHDIISAENGGISIKGGNSTSHALRFDDIGGTDRHIIYVDLNNDVKIGNSNFNNLYFSDQNVIFYNSKIGIGTSSPSESLEIVGTSKIGHSKPEGLRFQYSGATSGDWQSIGSNSNGDLILSAHGTINGNEHLTIQQASGNVGIGTNDPKNKLSVNGTIWASEVKVSLTDGADWVFEEDYELRTLDEVETFIEDNKHLPDVPSAEEFRKNGLNIAEMDNTLLQKIEELTLYLIEQNKQLQKANQNIEELQKEIAVLKEK